MIAESEVFDPRYYEAMRRLLLDAETLPVWCYTSGAFYRREVERIFHQAWNFIGAADRTQIRVTILPLPSRACRSSLDG